MNVMGAPRKYIQGPGSLEHIGELLCSIGRNPFFVHDKIVTNIIETKLEPSLSKVTLKGTFAEFGGECCRSEIERLVQICNEAGCDLIVGLGGGKTSDTAKAIKLELSLPLVIVPTIASNDSPTSRLIDLYTEQGAQIEGLALPFNPDIVLVDTGVIAKAPPRFLIAGIGDALATKFEAEQCYASGALNFFGARPCYAALAMADTCYQVIRKYGILATKAVENGLVTDALERVVEANILFSGIGFESGGLAAAHALNQGFTLLEEMRTALHGENVAFGLLVQFVLENRTEEFLNDMLQFYQHVGLPCTLNALGLKNITHKKLQAIARHACREGSYIHNMTAAVNENKVIDAILMADAIGRGFFSH